MKKVVSIHYVVLAFAVCVGIGVLVMSRPNYAQSNQGISVIRDSEIETYLHGWSAPLLDAAHIPQGSVNIILVQSDQLNAFVAGGSNIFFYTGLLERTDNPDEVMGVMAHELGHIAGGHLIRGREAMERASYESIIGAIIGIGAAVLSGEGGAAAAVISGSQSVALRNYLSHSRVHESSADQAALSYFEGAKLSPRGLASFFGKLENEEFLPATRQSEYMRTHPLTRNRIDAVETRAQTSPYKDKPMPAEWIDQHARMKAKLIGFISPGRVAWLYDDKDRSIAADYARAIAAYRQNYTHQAVAQIDALIAREPNNPYFYELKGQMLVDFSRIEPALAPYEKAIALKPEEPLFRIAYAHALIETGDDPARLNRAIAALTFASQTERRSTRIHRLLATAYGRLGDENLAKYHLAEEAVLQRRIDYANQLVGAVLKNAEPNSKAAIKAKDLSNYIKTLKRDSN